MVWPWELGCWAMGCCILWRWWTWGWVSRFRREDFIQMSGIVLPKSRKIRDLGLAIEASFWAQLFFQDNLDSSSMARSSSKGKENSTQSGKELDFLLVWLDFLSFFSTPFSQLSTIISIKKIDPDKWSNRPYRQQLQSDPDCICELLLVTLPRFDYKGLKCGIIHPFLLFASGRRMICISEWEDKLIWSNEDIVSGWLGAVEDLEEGRADDDK